jgi:hypothetical protein
MPKTETTDTAVKIALPDLQIEYARYTSSVTLTPDEVAQMSEILEDKQAQATKNRAPIGFKLSQMIFA